jgi:hypothetical protein
VETDTSSSEEEVAMVEATVTVEVVASAMAEAAASAMVEVAAMETVEDIDLIALLKVASKNIIFKTN